MGEKKQSEKFKKNAYKVIAVIAGILFVVLMVVSSMGSSWISGLVGVKPGDVVVLDYTLKDAQGNPLVTSDQTLYNRIKAAGYDLYGSKQMTITANQSLTTPVFPMQVYTPQSGWGDKYSIFASEYNAIGSGIIGMKKNEKKTINVVSGIPLTQYWTADQLRERKLNLSDVQVGTVIPLGVSENPVATTDNSTATYYIRLGEVINKDADGVTIDFSHPIIDVSIFSINGR
jgi:hypothetical protein